jgi:integrase
LLKETGMRSGEAIEITWIDIDFEKRTITCNMPEKDSNPRVITNISTKLIAMLNSLPRKNDHVFGFTTQNSLKAMFTRERKRLAFKLQNPRLLKIHFHTMRYWRGTMEYHRTNGLLHVKKLLGHKDIRNTELYVDLEAREFNFLNNEFIIQSAQTVEEATKLGEVGFEPYDVINGVHLFRKRK